MSSAASRLLSLGNNASLHNLIQRRLLRPSAVAESGASVMRLLNAVSEPQLSSELDAEDPKAYSITLPLLKPSHNAAEIMKMYSCGAADGHCTLGMFGLSGVDQSGMVKIHARRSDLTDNEDNPDYDFEDSETGAFDDDDDDGDELDFQDDDDDDNEFDKDEK